MAIPLIPIIGIAGKLLDKLFPDPAERARAQAMLEEQQLNGELKELELQLSAIVMEAQSQDKFTSRARPGFLYVVYTYILAAIPYSFIYAMSPEVAGSMVTGIQAFLAAIPDEMWGLFGVGYLGYTGARTWEKRKIIDRSPG